MNYVNTASLAQMVGLYVSKASGLQINLECSLGLFRL